MRIRLTLFLVASVLLSLAPVTWSQTSQDFSQEVTSQAQPLVRAARDRLEVTVRYDGHYRGIDYPNGDVPANIGVCTDVVIRTYRAAFGFDLQKAVHEDMRENFSAYPTHWGLRRPDKNIDHRRVPNLEVYLTRAGHDLPITRLAADYQPGDIVSWRLDGGSGRGGVPHIGIVSDRLSPRATPLIIHNIGQGPEESDILTFSFVSPSEHLNPTGPTNSALEMPLFIFLI